MYVACGLMLIFCILYYEDILVETQSILQRYALANILISFTTAKSVVRLWARLMSLWQDSKFEQVHNWVTEQVHLRVISCHSSSRMGDVSLSGQDEFRNASVI